MGTIYKKELKQMFTGMIGCVFIAFVFVLVGIYTSAYNLKSMYPNFEYVLGGVSFLFLILIPVLTMRSMAEETKSRTDQMLFTAPVSMLEIILGKFFALVTVLALPVLAFCFYPLILSQFGAVNYATAYSSLLAFFLLGCLLIAVGLFISCTTESQIIAAVLCFVTLFVSYMMTGIVSLIRSSAIASVIAFTVVVALIVLLIRNMTKNTPLALTVGCCAEGGLLVIYFMASDLLEGAFTALLGCFAAFDKLDTFASYGMFDLTALVYYITATALFLFFATQTLEKRRWN